MEDEQAKTSRQEWGLLTGWRMIAQEVMKGLGEATAKSDGGSYHASSQRELDDVAVRQSRLKSVIAKRGENFYMDYQMQEEIGSGAFGRAIKAKRRTDQEIVVVKELLGRKMTQKEILETKNEVKVLAHLNHPNVVKYHDFYADSGKMHIVMEYCQEGDLSRYLSLRNGALLEENEIMMKFVQICLALHHIHEQGILHRDLKSQNIFLTTHGILKLGDFGISRVMDNENAMAKSMVGTPYYLSPEICEDKPYGPKSDVWSLGCVLYELCMLKHAFDGQSLPALILKILSGNVPEIPCKYSSKLESLVTKLLCKNPDERPSVAQILNFDFVREHLQHFAAHIHFSVERRRDSFKRSLEPFNLTSQSAGLESGLQHRRSTTHSFLYCEKEGDKQFSLGKDNFGLRNWEDIEDKDEVDDTSFEISPYRMYTKDDETTIMKGRNLRSTQTEFPTTPESPLSTELAMASATLLAFKQELFGTPLCEKSVENKPTVQQDLTQVYTAEEYNTDDDHSEDTSVEEENDLLESKEFAYSVQREHVPNVVAQIHDIMKHPSTHLETG